LKIYQKFLREFDISANVSFLRESSLRAQLKRAFPRTMELPSRCD